MKLKRLFFLILGCVCLALGCVGIVLPVLPTVPFFLATVFCFANSSEKLHTWFLGTELYQKHLDSFVKKTGMTAQTKAGILMSVTLLMAVGFFLILRSRRTPKSGSKHLSFAHAMSSDCILPFCIRLTSITFRWWSTI